MIVGPAPGILDTLRFHVVVIPIDGGWRDASLVSRQAPGPMSARALLAAVACLGLAATLGCVTRERNEVVAARDAHARCVRVFSADHPSCRVLRERVLDAERRDESQARRAWSCDPAGPECPTPR
jgi:hypothetical protein